MQRVLRAYIRIVALLATSYMVAVLIAFMLYPNSEVVKPDGDLVVDTPVVEEGGELRFRSDVRRLQSCPGRVNLTLTSITNHGPPSTVNYTRPVRNHEIRPYDNVPRAYPLAESVRAGRWSAVLSVLSECPLRTRIDKLAEFEFTVTAKN